MYMKIVHVYENFIKGNLSWGCDKNTKLNPSLCSIERGVSIWPALINIVGPQQQQTQPQL